MNRRDLLRNAALVAGASLVPVALLAEEPSTGCYVMGGGGHDEYGAVSDRDSEYDSYVRAFAEAWARKLDEQIVEMYLA